MRCRLDDASKRAYTQVRVTIDTASEREFPLLAYMSKWYESRHLRLHDASCIVQQHLCKCNVSLMGNWKEIHFLSIKTTNIYKVGPGNLVGQLALSSINKYSIYHLREFLLHFRKWTASETQLAPCSEIKIYNLKCLFVTIWKESLIEYIIWILQSIFTPFLYSDGNNNDRDDDDDNDSSNNNDCWDIFCVCVF